MNFAMHTKANAMQMVLASTTFTEQSGLLAHILPAFKAATGIEVRVVALGTGQALDMARRGDVDALLVHDTLAEEKFVADGFGLKRHAVMHNDFVLIGPKADPAAAKGTDIVQALGAVTRANAQFVSRGDKSGTHAAELRLWKAAKIPAPGTRYRECGCGMGQALNIAAASGAYVLSDRGSWLAFKNRADLAVLVEGDARLFNPYGAIAVNPAKHPHVRAENAQRFIGWLTSQPGSESIASFKIGGEQLFFPARGR